MFFIGGGIKEAVVFIPLPAMSGAEPPDGSNMCFFYVCFYVFFIGGGIKEAVVFIPLPAMSGAEPPDGSNMLTDDPIDAEGISPSEPGSTEAASERMSPKRF